MNKSLTVLVLTAVAAVMSASCSSPTVEKLRDEQDKRLRDEPREQVVAEYKKKHEAKPDDAVAAYMYGRLIEDPAEGLAYADQLVERFPDFSWGVFLRCATLWSYGRVLEAPAACKHAAELSPKSDVFLKRAEEMSDGTYAVEAINIYPNFMEKIGAVTTDDFEKARKTLGGNSISRRGAEVLGYINGTNGFDKTWAMIFLQNGGGKTLQLSGEDIKAGWTVACFDTNGKRLLPLANMFPTVTGEASCRTCPGNTVEILPGQAKRVVAMFNGDPASLGSYCVFKNAPRPDAVVVLKLPPNK